MSKNTTSQSTSTKATSAKKETSTTKKANANAKKANARAGIEQAIKAKSTSEKYLLVAFAQTEGKFLGSFDFSKLKGNKVLEVFESESFRKVITNLYAAQDILTDAEKMYPGYVAEIRATLQKEAEAAIQAAKAENAKKLELTKNLSVEELDALINGGKA